LPVKFDMKVVKIGSSLRVTIPKQIADYLNIKEGNTLSIYADNSRIIMEREQKTKQQKTD